MTVPFTQNLSQEIKYKNRSTQVSLVLQNLLTSVIMIVEGK